MSFLLWAVLSVMTYAASPNEAWRAIEKLKKDYAPIEQQARSNNRENAESKINHLALMQQHLEYFIRQHSADARTLRARAWWVEIAPQVAQGLNVKLDEERWNEEIVTLEAATGVPPTVKGEIEAAIVSARLRAWTWSNEKQTPPEGLYERIERFLAMHRNDERAPSFAFFLGAMLQQSDESRATRAYKFAASAGNPQMAAKAETALAVLPYYHRPLDLVFTAVDGRQVNLASYRGKVVVLDFWATWCGPCVDDMPKMIALHRDFQARGMEIIGISLDQNRKKLEDYVAKNGISWPHYFDGLGWDTKLSRRFGISSIPAVWVIGRDGKVIETDARRNLRKLVAELLATPRKA
ncbi:MAG: TlpA disulfide reductase family protein [Candidatus Didemnitutus sp.]|nr:TlpA disulfide reductase family protein [Candidatus Didemnitutus sp.]